MLPYTPVFIVNLSPCFDSEIISYQAMICVERNFLLAKLYLCVPPLLACVNVREGYFGVYFPSCEATREINSKITLVKYLYNDNMEKNERKQSTRGRFQYEDHLCMYKDFHYRDQMAMAYETIWSW